MPNLDSGLLCQAIVGRAPYLAQFQQILDAARLESRGGFVAISGEAGIGKSRLTGELRRLAQAQEPAFHIAAGRCFEFDTSTPFAPIVDMLRGCLHARDPEQVPGCAGPDGAELLHILPELGPLLPGVQPAPSRDPDQDKRHLLAAIGNILVRLSSYSPLLIVLEDVHWSDDTSIEFLAQFARRAATSPIVTVLTFRSDEMQPALRRLLATLDRERTITDWPLSRLSIAEVAEMLGAIFSGVGADGEPSRVASTPSMDAVTKVHTLTEGNPFFIEEVLKSLSENGAGADITLLDQISASGVRVPRSVQAAVHERTVRLSDDARRVVELAAVAGRRFDFALLERLSGFSEDQLLDIIKQLIAAQLVAEESADHFVFRHALTQQTIYAGMLVRERRSLHGRIAEAIRAVYANNLDAHLNELAHHSFHAEAWDETYYFCRLAGERALRLHAPVAAAEHFTRSLDAAATLGVNVPPLVYRLRGQAHEAIGNFAAARRDYEAAFERAQAVGDGTAEWQALIDLGFLWAGRDYERAGLYFQHASDLAELLDDDHLRATSLNRLANWLVNIGRAGEGIALHEQALAIADRLDDDSMRAETVDLLGMANGLFGNQEASLRYYGEVLALYRRLDDKQGIATALAGQAAWASALLSEGGTIAPLGGLVPTRLADECVAAAEQTASVVGLAFAHMSAGQAYMGAGRYSRALHHAGETLRLATEAGHQQWLAAARWELGAIALHTYDPSEALAHLEVALATARTLGSAWWLGNTAAVHARAYIACGNLTGAEQLLASTWPPDSLPTSCGQRRVLLVWAELALALGDPATALQRIDHLIAHAPPSAAPRMPVIRRLRGEALAALRRVDEAAVELCTAIDQGTAVYEPPLVWPAYRALGQVYALLRRPDEAETNFGAARGIIDDIAAAIDDQQVRDRYLAGALATLPRPRSRTPNQEAKARFGGLTARERDVALLVARGFSNREIADELVLGERTIETHVGNILGKLSFNSRAQIAAWAVDSGLAAAHA